MQTKTAKPRRAERKTGTDLRCCTIDTRLDFLADEFKVFEQSGKTKWLLQENGIGRELRFRKIVGITRHIYYLNFWVELDHALSELLAAQPARRLFGRNRQLS